MEFDSFDRTSTQGKTLETVLELRCASMFSRLPAVLFVVPCSMIISATIYGT
jgi:hypothetical protein